MLMYRMTDRLSELTTNVSREAVEAFVRKKASPRHKMMMMPNGVDLAKFTNERKTDRALRSELGIGQDEFVWLAIGRLVDAKDYPTMLKAWAIVRKASAASALIIVGEGPDRLSLENLSRDLGLTDSVRFLGIRSDISSLMSVSDAYVMSSLWEGLPMVLLEASACELPIVATNVGGNREIIRDGISGYLTDSACPEQLADKMISLMKLPIEQREDMGRESRRFVMQHYEIGKIISQWESLYTDYVKSGLHRVGGLA